MNADTPSRLRALLDAATPLPWTIYQPSELPGDWRVGRDCLAADVKKSDRYYVARITSSHDPRISGNGGRGAEKPNANDAHLMVAAVNALPSLLAAAERVDALECLVSRLLAALQRTRVDDSSWHALLEEARQVSKGCALDVNGRCSTERVVVLEKALHNLIDVPYGLLDPSGECMYCRAKLACIDNEDREYYSGHKPECQVVFARAALNPNPNIPQ